MKTIDLNCDLGEWKDVNGLNKDASIMPFITSCNIACGGHIGDTESMQATINLAKEYGVAIGAHPSYPDKENFGRKVIEISEVKLHESIVDQLSAFLRLLNNMECVLHHIKPHGALYNEASINEKIASVVVSAILKVFPGGMVYCQQGSKLDREIIKARLIPVYEVFADRSYENDLTLRSRNLDGAVIHEQEKVFNHIHKMVIDGEVQTFSGSIKPIVAQTMCLHSDTKGSIELAEVIYDYLKSKGVAIAAS